FTLVALFGVAKFYDTEESFWPLLLAGAALALASIFKMVAIFPLIAICVYLVVAGADLRGEGERKKGGERVRRLACLLVPGAILWTIVFAYFISVGRFSAFWDAVFVYNTRYSSGLVVNVSKLALTPNLIFHPSLKEVWVLVLLSLAWFGFTRRRYNKIGRSLLIFFSIGLLVEIASPGKYYFHYYQLLLPVLCILPALFFDDLKERYKPARAYLPILIFTILSLAYYQWGYISRGPEGNSMKKYEEEFIEVREAAYIVKDMTAPCETIYSFGEETGLYYYSQRSAASGLFFIYALFFESEAERNIKLDRLYKDLTSEPPALFILEDRWAGKLEGRFKIFLEDRFRFVRRVNSYSIYELRARPVPEC
ncbi:MAG: hypothetical protein V3V95_04960, partial [Thermodesulfobacteriota bacterium]